MSCTHKSPAEGAMNSTLGEARIAAAGHGTAADASLKRRSRFRVRRRKPVGNGPSSSPPPPDPSSDECDAGDYYCAFMLAGLTDRRPAGGGGGGGARPLPDPEEVPEVITIRDPITVAVRRPGHEPLQVAVGLDNTVRDLKVLVRRGCGLPPDEQRLIFARREMDEGKTLAACGIADGSTLHARLRLRASF